MSVLLLVLNANFHDSRVASAFARRGRNVEDDPVRNYNAAWNIVVPRIEPSAGGD
jgi:hypothetical protein